MKNTLTIIALLILNYSCNNTAPKTDSETTIVTTQKTDSSALQTNNTLTRTTDIKTETPPPPPQARFVEMQAIRIEEEPETPPYNDEFEATTKPYSVYNQEDPISEAVGPITEIDSKTYTVVDQMPEMYMLKEFLYENMIYPEGPRDMGIQGEVKVGFVVDNNGRIKDVRTIKTSGNSELDKEAMRVIKKTSGKWKPGKINGKAVNTQMTLPITFQIDE